MPRKAKGLTAASLKTAKPGRYGDGDGLYLLVRSAESRFWIFRYTMPGRKMREIGLGRAGTAKGKVGLAEAREEAGKFYKQVRAGIIHFCLKVSVAAFCNAARSATVDKSPPLSLATFAPKSRRA